NSTYMSQPPSFKTHRHHPRTPRSGGRGGSSPVGVAATGIDVSYNIRRLRPVLPSNVCPAIRPHRPHRWRYSSYGSLSPDCVYACRVPRFRPGSSVGTSVRLKSGRSAVRPRPWPLIVRPAHRTRRVVPGQRQDDAGREERLSMAWVILIVSGSFEAVWATALGKSDGFTK